jgi:CRP-like cAMP-binding protein
VVEQDGVFVAGTWPPPREQELCLQFEAAWQRKLNRGVLSTSPLFVQLGPERTGLLLDCFERRVVPAKTVIQKRGEPPVGLVVLVEGRMSLSELGAGGNEVTQELGPGAVLAEVKVLGEDLAELHATAATDCVVLALSKRRFERLCRRYFELHQFVVEQEVARLNRRKAEAAGQAAPS